MDHSRCRVLFWGKLAVGRRMMLRTRLFTSYYARIRVACDSHMLLPGYFGFPSFIQTYIHIETFLLIVEYCASAISSTVVRTFPIYWVPGVLWNCISSGVFSKRL
jgi:hypothetical protein